MPTVKLKGQKVKHFPYTKKGRQAAKQAMGGRTLKKEEKRMFQYY